MKRDFLVLSRITNVNGSAIIGQFGSTNRGGRLLMQGLRFGKSDAIIQVTTINYGEENVTFNPQVLKTNFELTQTINLSARKIEGAFSIDFTSIIKNNNSLLYFTKRSLKTVGGDNFSQTSLKIKRIINTASSIEIQALVTLNNHSSMDINTSIMLLDEEIMRGRSRQFPTNFFHQFLFSTDPDKPNVDAIFRWRLEPKAIDLEKYAKGKLVVPNKPIVFVIDPRTPKWLIPYFKRGVESWNKLFENIGFKNVLSAVEVDNKDIDTNLLYTSHYSMIYYINSKDAGATFSFTVDPRSNEIIQGNILFSNGDENWIQENYYAYVGAVDSRVQSNRFDIEVLGTLIERTISHEIGHCLGFDHQMMASNSVKSRKLRKEKYLIKNGLSPSIMDYARYNYVAQPSDQISSNDALMSKIGEWDYWAIKVGYSYFTRSTSDEAINKILEKWQSKKKGKLKYRTDESGEQDVRAYSELLGDDPIYSTKMGIRNLKYLNENSVKWIDTSMIKNRNLLSSYYREMISQYGRLIAHVAVTILGCCDNYVEGKNSLRAVSINKQLKALKYLDKNCFYFPDWVVKDGLGKLLSFNKDSIIELIQWQAISNIIDLSKINRLLNTPDGNRKSLKIFKNLRHSILSELYSGKKIDLSRRKLQILFVRRIIEMKNSFRFFTLTEAVKGDITNLLQNEMKTVLKVIDGAEMHYDTQMDLRNHLQEMRNCLRGVNNN